MYKNENQLKNYVEGKVIELKTKDLQIGEYEPVLSAKDKYEKLAMIQAYEDVLNEMGKVDFGWDTVELNSTDEQIEISGTTDYQVYVDDGNIPGYDAYMDSEEFKEVARDWNAQYNDQSLDYNKNDFQKESNSDILEKYIESENQRELLNKIAQ
jgi:hypothetical protein